MHDATASLARFVEGCTARVRTAAPVAAAGRLTRVAGLVMEAVGLKLPVGSTCRIIQAHDRAAEAEVVGFNGERLFLMPSSEVHGLTAGSLVMPLEPQRPAPAYPPGDEAAGQDLAAEEVTKHLPVGDALLGRVVDGAGRPLDRLGPITSAQRARWPRGRSTPSSASPSNAPWMSGSAPSMPC